jgi:hypothetical protein
MARRSDDCVRLMLAQRCFVAAEVTSEGVEVIVIRGKAADSMGECIAVPTAEQADEAAAFRYTAFLDVTAKVEAKSQARELTSIVRSMILASSFRL